MPFLSINETTMKALLHFRLDDESDDQLITRLLEHARAHMIIKGAIPTETAISTALKEIEDMEGA